MQNLQTLAGARGRPWRKPAEFQKRVVSY